jgi:hypothetical protein
LGRHYSQKWLSFRSAPTIVGTGRTLSSVTLSGFSPGLLEYAVDDVQVASTVPEPAMGLLLAAGLLGLATLRRCRPSKALSSTLKITTKGEFL